MYFFLFLERSIFETYADSLKPLPMLAHVEITKYSPDDERGATVYYVSGWLVVQVKKLERKFRDTGSDDDTSMKHRKYVRAWLLQNTLKTLKEANDLSLPTSKMVDVAEQRRREGKLPSEFASLAMYHFGMYLEQTVSCWMKKLKYVARSHSNMRIIQTKIESAKESFTAFRRTAPWEHRENSDAMTSVMNYIIDKFFKMRGKDYCKRIVMAQETNQASASGVSLRHRLAVTSAVKKASEPLLE